jgi:predicted MPP superfamily phosphohydrolase
MLNLFHISDLHFTTEQTGQRRDSALAAVRALLQLAETLRADGTLGVNTCIAITGDLIQSGREPLDGRECEFEAVDQALLKPLMTILDVPPEQVFIVPGNHELDRDAVPEAERLQQGQYPSQKVCEGDVQCDLKTKLARYFAFVERQGYRSVTSAEPRIAFFEVAGQQIVTFNGLAGSYSREGYGDKGELFVLGSELSNSFARIASNAIVLTHHPLPWFADNCATDLKEFFSSRECRLLTGHIHDRGVEWVETHRGAFATVQAGASAEVGSANQVAISWLPPSNSAAVRHYALEPRVGQFEITPASDTKVVPARAREFFERSEAFFDVRAIGGAADLARLNSEADLLASSGKTLDAFVPPDISRFPEDQFSGRRTTIPALESDRNNHLISGDELSGKSSLLHYLAARLNRDGNAAGRCIAIALDYRMLEAGQSLKETILRRLTALELTRSQADYVLTIGRAEMFVDNFDPDASLALTDFQQFFTAYPRVRWTATTRGDQRYMPSRAPAALPKEGLTYYQLSETTLPTVLRMIENHESGRVIERPRAIVEQVFRSINNLRAPRTIFYVNSMVDVFLTDASVEPLNRYLLIENLLSDRIRAAHKAELPNEPVDMEMLETFIGQIAHRLMERSEPYLSKGDFYSLVEEFVQRKGLLRKRFDADTVLKILTRSFVLRDYELGYGFMMLSVEDYFLAKHMGRDEVFRAYIMSTEGLLTYPTVAEYYVAQNPSDRPRIESILALIDEFQREVAPLVDQIRDSSTAAIRAAHPGGAHKLQDGLLEKLGKIENADDPTLVRFEDPRPVGRTKRLRFAAEERGAVFLQLGASILGVTRTLDQADRIEIFKRLRTVLLTSLHALPIIAQHLADGGQIRFRGMDIKADYVGELAVEENRFYIILRGMIFNLFRNFGTWAGSPSFFNAAVALREGEESELVRGALFAQNIEADLLESLDFIPSISDDLHSLVLKEIMVRLYLEAMTLVPLEREHEARALERLVDATIKLDPPDVSDAAALDRHRVRLRQSYSERIGYNAYVGRLVKVPKRPEPRPSRGSNKRRRGD